MNLDAELCGLEQDNKNSESCKAIFYINITMMA